MKLDLTDVYHPDIPALLAELAATPEMERLKWVGMNCGCEYTGFPRFVNGKSYSRWLHSLGVGLIVWHFTQDPAQAAAGLLHDVATPTFAHVVDFLRGDYLTQEATEAGTRERIENSPAIRAALEARGLAIDAVADYHVYPIADNDSPRLSADRLEYTLGNSLRYGFLDRPQIAALYEDLTVGENGEGTPELCFRTPEAALCFARAALACAKVYVSPEDRHAMQTLSELLEEALAQGILTEADLQTTEPALIRKLEASALAPAWGAFCRMNRILTAPAPADSRPWRQVPAKKRRIDPWIRDRGRTSACIPAFRRELEAFLADPQSEWLLGL